VQINGLGAGATGVLAGLGRLVLEDVDIDLTHERSGAGMQIVGEAQMRGGSIHARGINARVVSFAASGGGKLLLDGVEMSGYHGIGMAAGSELTMYNSQLDTNSIGININKAGGVVEVAGSSITTRNGVGILMFEKGDLDVRNSIVTADGEFWQAVSIMDGTARVQPAADARPERARHLRRRCFGPQPGTDGWQLRHSYRRQWCSRCHRPSWRQRTPC